MKKPKLPSIRLLLAIILAVAVVEIANLLLPIQTAGSVTIKDEIGETSRPELPFLDIVDATVEKNETNLTIVMQINGYVPSQIEPSEEGYVRYTYYFNTLVCVELKGIVWTPMLGHFVYKMGWFVDYAGEDFPGSFLTNKETRIIQIILDLGFLREREVYRATGVTSDTFTWSIDTYAEYQTGARTHIDQISSYFPDYLSFHRSAIHALALIIIGMGGISLMLRAPIWNFLTGKTYRQIHIPKQVRILEVIYRLHSVYWLCTIAYLLYMALAGVMGTFSFIPLIAALCISIVWYSFVKTANGILRGNPSAKYHVLVLSTVTAIFGFYMLLAKFGGVFAILFFPFYYRLGAIHGYPLITTLIDYILGATSLLCIFYLTRPQVRAFLSADKEKPQHQ